VNAVCPGLVDTDRLNYEEINQAKQQGVDVEELRSTMLRNAATSIPLGRVAAPTDVANLVAFLASPEASFITGQACDINGGAFY